MEKKNLIITETSHQYLKKNTSKKYIETYIKK